MNGQLTLAPAIPYATRARAWIEHLQPGEEFTADAIRSAIGEPDDPNTLGAVIVGLSKAHKIIFRGREMRSGRHEARGRWQRVWVKA